MGNYRFPHVVCLVHSKCSNFCTCNFSHLSNLTQFAMMFTLFFKSAIFELFHTNLYIISRAHIYFSGRPFLLCKSENNHSAKIPLLWFCNIVNGFHSWNGSNADISSYFIDKIKLTITCKIVFMYFEIGSKMILKYCNFMGLDKYAIYHLQHLISSSWYKFHAQGKPKPCQLLNQWFEACKKSGPQFLILSNTIHELTMVFFFCFFFYNF